MLIKKLLTSGDFHQVSSRLTNNRQFHIQGETKWIHCLIGWTTLEWQVLLHCNILVADLENYGWATGLFLGLLVFDWSEAPSLQSSSSGKIWNFAGSGVFRLASESLSISGWNKAWRRACFFKWSLRMNLFSHIGQLKFFSPKSGRKCLYLNKTKFIRTLEHYLQKDIIL